MVDLNLDLRRLVVESLAAGSLAYGVYMGLKTATDLSAGPLGASAAPSAVFTVKAAAWLWDAKTKKTEAA